jgi:thiamine-monophosphate kinase
MRAWSETELLDTFFRDLGARRADVTLGIGDDAALVRTTPGTELVMTTDALVEGEHFLPGADARSLGHRALAINLSDIAAMGAMPSWALLALTLPRVDDTWLRGFADGFGALARAQHVALVGGNLSLGPLTVTVQLTGEVPVGTALRRDGARAGDALYVSGTLGDARAALALQRRQLMAAPPEAAFLRQRAEFPDARLELGSALRGVASACIDISDGLHADLGRVLQASACGAVIDVDSLPLSPALRAVCGADAWQQALAGGEDYELCFTVPAASVPAVARISTRTHTLLARIGSIRQEPGIELRKDDAVIQFSALGYDHFRR